MLAATVDRSLDQAIKRIGRFAFNDCCTPSVARRSRDLILRINYRAIREGWHHRLSAAYRGTGLGPSKRGETIKGTMAVLNRT